jgi:AAA domain/Bifunctional DNA primase/polymerase, N-terminal
MTAAPILPPGDEPLTPDDVTRTLNRALSVASKGYRIFPVHPGTKRAGTDAEHSPDSARWGCTSDPDRIRSWWGRDGQFRGYSIGVATGESGRHGIVLIDCDVKDSQGNPVDGPGNWAALYGRTYPIAAAVGHSPRGGLHFPFRADPKRPVKTGTNMIPGVDVRGVGGMFVLRTPFFLPAPDDLPLVPDVVCERMPRVEHEPAPVVIDPERFAPAGEVAARVLQKRDELAAWPHAGKAHPRRPDQMEKANDGAARLAWEAGQYVGAGQLEQDWVVVTLQSAFSGWTWAQRDDEATMMRTVAQQVAKGAGAPKAWTSEPVLATVSELSPTRRSTPLAPRQTPGPLQAEVSPVPTLQGLPRSDDDDETVGGSLVSVHPGRHVVLTPLSSIPIRRARWLWDGRIPAGAISLVAGKQGLGKSTLVYDLVAQMTRGELPGEFAGTPRAALICATEDDWSCTIAPRLVASGVDPERVFRVDAVRADGIVDGLVLPADVGAVEQAALEVGAAMLVLDPLTSRLDSALDGHKDGPVRQALEPLAAMAGRTGIALVGLMHLNKGAKSDPMDAVMGATAFTAVARSVLIVMRDPDDEERRRKFVGLAKNNLGDIDLPTLVFRTVTALVPTDEEDDRPAEVGRIEWLGQAEGSIADAMESASQDDETRTGIADSVRWLKEHLAACGGEADAMSIKDAARKAGFHERMISRARKRAGVVAATIPGSFPRRTTWALKAGRGARPLSVVSDPVWVPNDTPDPTTDTLPLAKNTVSTVSTVSTGTDSTDREDDSDGAGDGVRTAVTGVSAHADDGGYAAPAVAENPPPWAAEPDERQAAHETPGGPVVAAPPCPCGRSANLHFRGNWRTCQAGHSWHARGAEALDACPQCPTVADPATVDVPDGGDAA